MVTSRRERKKQETRERIVTAALELFQARGFEETTITAIAEAADVSRSTFFNYFATKEELLTAIAAAELRELERLVEEELVGLKAVDKICRVVHSLVADVAPFLQITRRVLLESLLRPECTPSPVTQVGVILERLVREGQKRQEIRTDLDAADAARLIVGACLAVLFHWIERGHPVSPPTEAEVRAALEVLFTGIGGPAYTPPGGCHHAQ